MKAIFEAGEADEAAEKHDFKALYVLTRFSTTYGLLCEEDFTT